jgi:hypothetical protein
MTEEERRNKFALLLDDYFDVLDTSRIVNAFEDWGFFRIPASVSHHGNYEGGLFEHSLAVTKALLELTERLGLKWQRSASPVIVGMFHDLCKCYNYEYNTESGQWQYKKNPTMTGHGELSVIIGQQIIPLTDEEILCIRWHMGAYDDKDNWNKLGRAIEICPNVLYTHTADMIASRVKGI